MTPTMTENHEISILHETSRGDPRKLLEYTGRATEGVRVPRNDFRTSTHSLKNDVF